MATIRHAAPDDASPIAAIWNPLIRDTAVTFASAEKTGDDIRRLIAERRAAFLVAEEEGAVLGFASFAPFRGGSGYLRTMEHTIILGRAAQGRGVGRRLIEALAEEAARREARSLIAAVSGENAAGIAFHSATGFEIRGRIPEAGYKFGRFLDLVLMQRRL